MSIKGGKHNFEIIFDHPEYVVVNKPAGLLSVPERFTDEVSLRKLLNERFGKIYVVHRLDKFTSGIILFAKNEESHRVWNELFEKRKVTKKYLAITTGLFRERSGVIDLPILSLPGQNKVVINKRGKASQTAFQVLEQMNNHAFVELDLHTGRTHQIRIHLMAHGNPLLVDPAYGGESEFFVSDVKGKNRFHLEKGTEERALLTRTPLHASRIQFADPFDGEERAFEVEMPKDMKATLYQLKKWGR